MTNILDVRLHECGWLQRRAGAGESKVNSGAIALSGLQNKFSGRIGCGSIPPQTMSLLGLGAISLADVAGLLLGCRQN
jgi:hypothetical protein